MQLSTVLISQYQAALSTLGRCLRECPDQHWESLLAKLTFDQAAFHALFYADLYLNDQNDHSFQQQDFHRQHAETFADYEEMQDRQQVSHYRRTFLQLYLQHLRTKVQSTFSRTDETWLSEPSPFDWIPHNRIEVHVYNIRHIQHHAAQLILFLRQNGLQQFPWHRAGYRED